MGWKLRKEFECVVYPGLPGRKVKKKQKNGKKGQPINKTMPRKAYSPNIFPFLTLYCIFMNNYLTNMKNIYRKKLLTKNLNWRLSVYLLFPLLISSFFSHNSRLLHCSPSPFFFFFPRPLLSLIFQSPSWRERERH